MIGRSTTARTDWPSGPASPDTDAELLRVRKALAAAGGGSSGRLRDELRERELRLVLLQDDCARTRPAWLPVAPVPPEACTLNRAWPTAAAGRADETAMLSPASALVLLAALGLGGCASEVPSVAACRSRQCVLPTSVDSACRRSRSRPA